MLRLRYMATTYDKGNGNGTGAKRRHSVMDAPDRPGFDASSLREGGNGMTPDLESQTPGLDADRFVRDGFIRAASWVKERPLLVGGILGGIALAGVGIWLGMYYSEPKWKRISRRQLARFGLDDLI